MKRKRPYLHFIGSFLAGLLDMTAKLFGQLAQNIDSNRVVQQVERFRPDIVHQHMYLPELVTSWRLSRKYAIVFTNHTGAYIYMQHWLSTRFLQNRFMGLFAQIIAPSRELLPPMKRSHYIPNGVDLEIFHPPSKKEREQLREFWDCSGKFVCICPRRWAPTKGIIYLARAISLLSPEIRRKCLFIFAGNETHDYPHYRKNLMKVLGEVENTEVRILGNLGSEKLAELMAAADLTIIPSILEATSLSCLESMACGTPVLGTLTGGLPELMQDGFNGWLVPPEDPGAIAAKIEEIILNSGTSTVEAIKTAALELVQNHYSWDSVAAQTVAVYELAIKESKSIPLMH